MVALIVPATASAAIEVANENDSGPGSLRQAAIDAPPGETIQVPAGNYALSTEIALEKSVRIVGAGAESTVIRGDGSSRLFKISGVGNTLTLNGVTLRGGRMIAPSAIAHGGAIEALSGNLVLQSVIVTDNVADASGGPGENGGIAEGGGIFATTGNVTILDSALTANTADASGGSGESGGIGEGGALWMSGGDLTIERSNLSGNSALSLGGQGPSNPGQFGGIAEGGGIWLAGPTPGARIAASTIGTNRADAAAGPGGSFAGIAQGGGLYLVASVPVELSETTVADNSTGISGGGGIGDGGGIYATIGGEASLSLLSSTLAANTADAARGGNLYIIGPAKASNTIVSGGAGNAGFENCDEPIESGGFNLESANQCGFAAAGDQVNVDPLLGPLQDNGGPAPTMEPTFGGPAVDRGAAFGLATDERGLARTIDFPTLPNSAAPGADGSDVGAVEVQASTAFGFRKLTRNKKKGFATIRIRFPQPTFGTVVLFGKGLKKKKRSVSSNGTVRLRVATKGGVRKQLFKRGHRKVRIKVRYAAVANPVVLKARTVKLVKKKRSKSRRRVAG